MRKSRVRPGFGLNARVEVVDLRGAGLMKSSIVQLVASLLILLASLAPTSLAQSSSTGAITGSTQEKGPAQTAAKNRAIRFFRQQKFCCAQSAGRRQSAVPHIDRAAAQRTHAWHISPARQGVGQSTRLAA